MHVVVTIQITIPNSFFNHGHIHGYFKAFTITITITIVVVIATVTQDTNVDMYIDTIFCKKMELKFFSLFVFIVIFLIIKNRKACFLITMMVLFTSDIGLVQVQQVQVLILFT